MLVSPIALHGDYTIDQTLNSVLKAMGTNISGTKWKQLEQIKNWQMNVSFMRPINLSRSIYDTVRPNTLVEICYVKDDFTKTPKMNWKRTTLT